MVDKLKSFSLRKSLDDMERINLEEVKSSRNPIIFDTNFLFITFEFKLDVIAELEKILGGYSLYIYEGTISELENIEKKKDKNKRFLPLISKMLHIYNFKIIQSDKDYIDDQILSNLDENIIIATNDKNLRQVIQKKHYKVLYMRQKKFLEIK